LSRVFEGFGGAEPVGLRALPKGLVDNFHGGELQGLGTVQTLTAQSAIHVML